jgi:hypothetical protein
MTKNLLTRSGAIINGVSTNNPGMSIKDIALDQYNQRNNVTNVHKNFADWDKTSTHLNDEHSRWSLNTNGTTFVDHAAASAKDLLASRLGINGGKRRYTYHKKSKRSHSKTGGRRRKYSTTKKHRRGRK